jgi:amino acid adenylation domain-containing protein
MTFHHIIVDAWSVGLFIRDLSTYYRCLVENKPVTLPENKINYGDFSVWQHQQMETSRLQQQLTYWTEKLEGYVANYELPQDFKRPVQPSFRGANTHLRLNRRLTQQLKDLAGREGVTLFMLLLSAFKVLLYRYTNETDILVGSPIANRNRPEIENLMGFFVNTLALRTDLSGNPNFLKVLADVRETTLGAYTNQDIPFEKVVEAVHPDRRVNHTPIVQVMFMVQNTPMSHQELPGVTLSLAEVDSGTSKFDLIFQLEERDSGLDMTVNFANDLFRTGTVRRMMIHFRNILESIVENPNRTIDLIHMLETEERVRILRDWNHTSMRYPKDETVVQWFEKRLELHSEDPAVWFDETRLTYEELNQRANQIAWSLIARGVEPQSPIAISMMPSAQLVATILGVLKAGCIYVPLDPSHPIERLAGMLEDSQSRLLVVDPETADTFTQTEVPQLCISEDWAEVRGLDQHNPANRTVAKDIAYIIYTSGSTGRPKGVMVSHQAIMRLVLGANFIQIRPEDRVAQIANFSFDAVTFEIWGSLLNGAELVGIAKELAVTPQTFARHLKEKHIHILFITTALFNHIAAEQPDAFSELRCVLFGGEACEPNWIAEIIKHGPPEKLLHVYGPTENTTFSTYHSISQVPRNAATMPIGSPISNTTAYVLDKHLNPVPVGAIGELYHGGDGLAEGYLNRPDLTAEKFIPHPFAKNPGERIYRTGDIVRFLASGDIEFHGRIDNQVKIRGFRIELNEIERVLNQHDQVHESVCKAWGNPDKKIAAYLVPTSDTLDEKNLRDFLRAKLPEYMIPSSFNTIAKIPITPNGKVDHRALPEPQQDSVSRDDGTQPQTQLEQTIAGIWSKLFNIESPILEDNFFDLGGHSLLITQLQSRLRDALGVQLELRELFAHPTLGSLAEFVKTKQSEASTTAAQPTPDLPISRRQRRRVALGANGEITIT